VAFVGAEKFSEILHYITTVAYVSNAASAKTQS